MTDWKRIAEERADDVSAMREITKHLREELNGFKALLKVKHDQLESNGERLLKYKEALEWTGETCCEEPDWCVVEECPIHALGFCKQVHIEQQGVIERAYNCPICGEAMRSERGQWHGLYFYKNGARGKYMNCTACKFRAFWPEEVNNAD